MTGVSIREGIQQLVALRKRPRPEVGGSTHRVVHHENKWRLLRFARTRDVYRTPILLVPSMINRWYVLDLMPERSLVAWLADKGHDVFVIDWGTPGPEDRYLSFDDVVGRYIGRAIRRTCRAAGTTQTHVMGYCMGGTLSVIHAAVYPERIASLTAVAAPVTFDDEGLLSKWSRDRSFDVDAFGNAPWQLLQGAFQLLRPNLSVSKFAHLVDRAFTAGAWSDSFLDAFLAKERWANDNVSVPGEVFRRWVGQIYRDNSLFEGTLRLDEKPVLLSELRMPLHVVSFAADHIVPPETAAPLATEASSTDLQHVELPGGHIGAVVGGRARDVLWPLLHEWWAEREPMARTIPTLPG